MGVIKAAVALAVVYTGFRVAETSLHRLIDAAAALWSVALALGKVADVLSHPPGSVVYSGPPTWWIRVWKLLTLGPMQALIAPGSFTRSYALLVAPALAVAVVACLALLVRSNAVAQLLKAFLECWRGLLAAGACLVAALLLDDAVRAYVHVGRMFIATLRGSAAMLLAFCGLVGLLGPPESGGFSWDQTTEWLRALGLMAAAATSAIGGSTLILHSNDTGQRTVLSAAEAVSASPLSSPTPTMAAVTATIHDTALTQPQAVDRLSFLLYGSLLLLAAAGFASGLTESDFLRQLGWAALRLLRLQPLLKGARWAIRWVRDLRLLRDVMAAIDWADDAVTPLLKRGFRKAEAFISVLVEILRRWLAWVGSLVRALYRHVLLPVSRAAWAIAAAVHSAVLWPLAKMIWALLRQRLMPVLWPTGAVAGTMWFLREAVSQRAMLPFGAAAVVSAVIALLMAGKAMRKSHYHKLSLLGESLEHYAATAYLNLDLGVGRPVANMLGNVIAVAWLTAVLLVASGRRALALLAVPLVGLLAAAMTVVTTLWRYVVRVLYPWVAAVWHAAAAAVAAVWSHPEWSLVLAALVLAASYGAHAVQLPSVLAAWAAAIAAAVGRHLFRLLALPLRVLISLADHAAAWLGISAGAGVRAAAVMVAGVAGWGRSSGSNMSSLFSSYSFAGAFLGLNLFHALLLKGWAIPMLEVQGDAGRAAVVPVISFMARSTGKVALGPMYLTAVASFLAGRHASGLALHLASLTVPALWVLYLVALWLEGVRRISYRPEQSNLELGRALQAVSGVTRNGGWVSRPILGRLLAFFDIVSPPLVPNAVPPRLTSGQRPPAGPAATAPDVQRLAATTAAVPAGPVCSASASASISGFSPPVIVRDSAASREGPTAPSFTPAALSPLERRLYDGILAQGSPGCMFPTKTCIVCFDEIPLLGPMGHWRPRLGREGPTDEQDASGALAPLPLRCGHVFHQRCVLQWLKRNPRCPVCREPAIGGLRHTNILF
ncbi:hypothetical protein Vretifemale_5318 [Volvox reticuliferus]|uniref:RING-type domain-containing protein n=1 Tax=Volvox reticuliferus TaxID=1737510 RepID=A0A8J4C4U0_9CHLO|nr:hypothetical protein Vretifemale_5318 [Volvox reticuliferus]